MELDHGSDSLKNTHIGNSVLLVDKYLDCSIPSAELEFILESQNKFNYNAWLDPEFQFKHSICSNEEVISEIFSPRVQGEHFNPYIRYKSCLSSASRTCSQLMDLVGLEIKDISMPVVHDNIFLDLVCTFPKSIDYYLYNSDCRVKAPYRISKHGKKTSQLVVNQNNLIDRMNRCRKRFFDELNKFFTLGSTDRIFGCSTSLHLWSSEVPILPNCHVHNIVSGFSYSKKPDLVKCTEILDLVIVESTKVKDYSYLPDSGDECISVSYPVVAVINNGTKKITRSQTVGPCGILREDGSGYDPISDAPSIKITSEIQLTERFIVDRSRYEELRLHLSSELSKVLEFHQMDWATSGYPVDIDRIKDIWSDVVYDEFQDFMECRELLDVHVSWIPWYNKSKLLHSLQYKCRPPVLDLDLFFKRCPGVVTGYDKINTSIVLDYLEYQLQVAINCSNLPDINRYESLLGKAEELFSNYSDRDVLDWLKFLSTWVTDTRVYGFWKNLKRYMLDPEHKFLVEEKVCPICGGSISSTNLKTQACVVSHVFVRTRSKFLVYDLGDPGG